MLDVSGQRKDPAGRGAHDELVDRLERSVARHWTEIECLVHDALATPLAAHRAVSRKPRRRRMRGETPVAARTC